jgi:ribonuclease E
VLFKAPDPTEAPVRRTRKAPARAEASTDAAAQALVTDDAGDVDPAVDEVDDADNDNGDGVDSTGRRRRRRGGRRRRKGGDNVDAESPESDTEPAEESESEDGSGEGTSRRRRRRRRTGDDGSDHSEDSQNTVTRVRSRRSAEDEITSVAGSTRLEAKKQRRREGREAGRRRAPIVSEAEFLARRESVDRVMVVRQRDELTQIAVLEDKVLVEHYVARESQTSLIGNVYLGRVQNVLPSMEAAFVDIGKGRNAVLYAGEVNWSAMGHKDGQPRKIESVLSSGQPILVQVTKDPVGHKGARLTSQVSLAGRFLVYVPDGTTSGISRKLPDTERQRLKTLLKEIVPDTAGVIVRTAAEGASEDELTRDVERLKARWEDIEAKAKGNAPALLYGEPDLTLKVVRDLFTEDFAKLVIEGDEAWDTVQGYVAHVAPDLETRLERFTPANGSGPDVFSAYRIDEQIAKGLDRKVWLPSGGSLVIDRTEAMTVVDVNTGKFTGSGGNLEETVTRNNLEAADEIVRQLRLRDIGGIIVVDFIDMVLESNRDLVLRRLAECLGRDRTRHQVAEVTSLGLVQMTRKRIGTGLLEAFSETCEHCQGRGVIVHEAPVPPRGGDDDRRPGRRSRGRGRGGSDETQPAKPATPSPRDVAAVARPDNEPVIDLDYLDDVDDVDLNPIDPSEASDLEPMDTPADRADDERADEAVVEVAEHAAETEPAVLAQTETEEASAPAPAAAPAVVVRTRRRAASRPAGPPEELAPIAAPAEGDAASGGDPQAPQFEHVPIKRKGARKR